MSKFHFTTVLSGEYIYKFLVMYETLKYHCKDFMLFSMCADEESYKILKELQLNSVEPLYIEDIYSDQLEKARRNRSNLEFCWTLKPITLDYVMEYYRDAEYYAHLDADLVFFAAPDVIFDEAPEAELYLVDHNNSKRFQHTYHTSGRFNTGFVGCRNSKEARKAVGWWRNKCLEACPSKADPVKKLYGDQRYVERWLELFEKVHIVKNKGVNVAIWNIEGLDISLRDQRVYVNDDLLVFYHFSGLIALDA
ncbi:MAG: hypothetical protein AB2421_11805, partial [Thermotaleaceae bacterium]